MRIVFAGTPAFGLPIVEAIQENHDLVAIYTQPDRAQGRGLKQQYTPIKTYALAQDIPVFQPEHFKSPETLETLKMHQAEVMVVVAYGLILPAAVLAIPDYGCINVHASLLPRWRGASPIQYALLAGDAETGVTIMQMNQGMDTGDILAKQSLPITQTETAGSLHDKLSQLSVAPLLTVLEAIASGVVERKPQGEKGVTYAPKMTKEAARIDWTKKAVDIARMIRAFLPWPVAYMEYDNQRFRIFEAHVEALQNDAPPGTIIELVPAGLLVATGEGGLRITQIQSSGGKVLPVSAWMHGRRL